MAQVIVYENGNAIGGEGHPTYARDITFENTGTDLVSEEVESAIKEVNNKTKHGLVELWANPNPTSNFAGQTITINGFDATILDAIELEISNDTTESTGVDVKRFETSVLNTPRVVTLLTNVVNGSTGKFQQSYRVVTITLTGTTLTLAFQDGNYQVLNTYGSTPTITTDNSKMIPTRILGLIHND